MTPVWRIARHEFRRAWRTRAVAASAVVFALLAGVATVTGVARYEAERSQRERYQAIVGSQFEAQPDRHPHRVSHYGFLIFRPRAPLGFFDAGLERFAGTSLFLEAHRQNLATLSPAAEAGSNERFGELTLALVLQLFAPLLVFAIAGVSITREREEGTLALLLCQGVAWRAIVWGKFWGALFVVASVTVPALALVTAWLQTRIGMDWNVDLVERAALLGCAHATYLSGCTALAIAVSARHRSSRGALLILLGAWISLWVALPRVMPVLSTALHPTPVRVTFDADVERRVRELGDSHDPNDPKFRALRDRTLAANGVGRIEELPFNYSGLVMRESERLTTESYLAETTRLFEIYRRQARVIEWAGVVSPYVAIRMLSMSMAGSDLSHLLEFERQAEEFRYGFIQALNDLHINEVNLANDRYGAVIDGAPTRQRISHEFFERLPTFDYRAPVVTWAIGRQPAGILATVLAASLLMALLARATRYHGVTT